MAATRAFGITTATFALVALIAAAGAHRAARTPAAPLGTPAQFPGPRTHAAPATAAPRVPAGR